VSIRSGWLRIAKHTINPIAARSAAKGHSAMFALVEHVGRKSGRRYETPIIVAPVPAGFVAELTYGPGVDWYRNIKAAGHCQLLREGHLFDIDSIRSIDESDGLRAFGPPKSWLLRALRRHDFLLLHVAGRPSWETR